VLRLDSVLFPDRQAEHLGTDLHQPLGKGRSGSAKKQTSRSALIARVFMVALLLVVAGLSLYGSFGQRGLQTEVAVKPAALPDGTPVVGTSDPANPAPSRPDDKNKNSALDVVGNSGAQIDKMTADDGSTITKFSPKQRATDGPVVLTTDAGRATDPRFAGKPNDNLLEDSDAGPLPVIGSDGTRPFDYYARPWSGARGTRIAIVVGGLGLSQTGTQNAIKELPEEITLAFAASGNSLSRWMQEAKQNGHEILLQVPFEPYDYPQTDPGPGTLLSTLPPEENLALLHRAMAQFTNYTGIINFLGGRFLSDAEALDPVMRDIAKRGLMFLDDGTSAQSLTEKFAKAVEMPYAFADVQLDNEVDKEKILRKLDDLERIADRKGSAIGVASGFDESLAAIREWSTEAAKRGVEIVGVSALAGDPQNRN
jgi:polysaccharide deacetylase 2 family uncharacterized protein YibQ